MSADWIGKIIDGRYIVDGILGSGGMGMVFRARHKFTGGTLAIKVLKPELAADPEIQHRFLAEARAANTIGHPNIVQVIDAGRSPDGILYLAMELLVGRSLREPLARAELRPADMRVILAELLDALTAAHARGFVHRDLKPENVFLVVTPNGFTAKLLDFGIAKVIDTQNVASVRTATGSMLGTPAYMSPEQIANPSNVDARTDLWAVGVMVYEMLTGRLPFPGSTVGELMVAVATQPPRSIKQFIPTASPQLEQFFARALARDPSARFATAHEMRVALDEVLTLRPSNVPIAATQSAGMVGLGAQTPAPVGAHQMTQATGYGAGGPQMPGPPSGPRAHTPSSAPPPSSASPQSGTPGYTPSSGTPGYATPQSGTPGYTPSSGTPGYTPSSGTPGYTPSSGAPGYTPSSGTPGYATPPSGTPHYTPGASTPGNAGPGTGATPAYGGTGPGTGATPAYGGAPYGAPPGFGTHPQGPPFPTGTNTSPGATIVQGSSKTPWVIGIVGTVGIVAIVLAIVLTRTKEVHVVTKEGPVATNPPDNTTANPPTNNATTNPPTNNTTTNNATTNPPNNATTNPNNATTNPPSNTTTNNATTNPPNDNATTNSATPKRPKDNVTTTKPVDPYATKPGQQTTTPPTSQAPGSTMSIDERCQAGCDAARKCGLATGRCIADCKADAAIRTCTDLALAKKCGEAALCAFRSGCRGVQLGSGTCQAAMTCQATACAPGDWNCGCRCAGGIAQRNVYALMRVDVCAINCNFDPTCIEKRCMVWMQACNAQ